MRGAVVPQKLQKIKRRARDWMPLAGGRGTAMGPAVRCHRPSAASGAERDQVFDRGPSRGVTDDQSSRSEFPLRINGPAGEGLPLVAR